MGKALQVFLIFFFVINFPAMALAAEKPATSRHGKQATAFISGTVTDDGGSPVAGARAEAFSCGDDAFSGVARTDNQGKYRLGPVVEGCYHFRFHGAGYESTWYGNEGVREVAADVDVAVTVEGIDGALTKADSAISGTVRSQDGKPLAGAWVTAWQLAEGKRSISDGRTDEKGQYKVEVGAGKYVVLFMAKGYATKMHGTLEKPSLVEAEAEKTVRGIDAVLAKGGRITGTVTDDSGKPLQEIYVVGQSTEAAASLPITARTSATGAFTLDGVPTGRYRIAFGDRERKYQLQWYDGKANPDEATEIAVTAPKTTSGIKGILRMGGGVAGRVTDETGNALAGVAVQARGENFSFGAAVTDETGAYTLFGLSSGTYKISFAVYDGVHLSRFYQNAATEETAAPVGVIAPNITYGIDQVLPTGTQLSGTVRHSGGDPIEGVAVAIYPAGEVKASMMDLHITGPDGTFSVPLPEGEYVVHFDPRDKGYLEQWSGMASTRKEARPVSISRGQGAEKLDVVLSFGGTISGTIRNKAGAGIAGVRVSALDAATGEGVQSAVSTEGGSYAIKGLHSGSFRIAADGTTAGYIKTKLYPVEVTAPGVAENIDMVLPQGGSISGKVSDRTGKPLPRIDVTAYDPETWVEVGSAYTDEKGSYSIGGLPEGKYRIRFETPDSQYPLQWYKGKIRREDSVAVEVSGTALVSGVDAVLTAGSSLSGMVTDQGGRPLAEVEVEIYGDIEDEPFDKVRTDATGKFTVRSLAAGNYRIRFSHPDHVPQWYGGRDRRTAIPFAVKEEGTSPVSISLAKGGGKISGKLTNPQGVKIGQAWETVIDALTGVAVADERICECSGQFNTPVPAGTYQIRIERHGFVTWFGGNTREEAVPLTVNGEIEGLDMVIEDKVVRQKQQNLPNGKP